MWLIVRKLFEKFIQVYLCQAEAMHIFNSNVVELALAIVENIVISNELLTFLFITHLELLIVTSILIDSYADYSLTNKVHLSDLHVFVKDNSIIMI